MVNGVVCRYQTAKSEILMYVCGFIIQNEHLPRLTGKSPTPNLTIFETAKLKSDCPQLSSALHISLSLLFSPSALNNLTKR